MMDGDTKELIDILPDRRLNHLENYFSGFSLKNRSNVEYIVTDIYKTYVILAKKLFPNAKVVLDKFHLVQHIGRAFQKIRIRRMNQLKNKHNGTHYRRIKKYWKLLQKKQLKLDFQNRYWRAGFKTYLSEKKILERLLTYDTELSQAYSTYQDILRAFQVKDFSLFLELINQPVCLKEYVPIMKTYKTYQNEIETTFQTHYSNGPLECMNNHIKVIKRNAYGMRSFYNFKLRIAIHLKRTPFKTPKKT